MVQPLWRTAWRFLNELKIKLAYNPTVPFLGIDPEKTKLKDTCTPAIMAALGTIAKT